MGLVVDGTEITSAQQEAITERVAAISEAASFTVERGYEAEDATLITSSYRPAWAPC